jgi:hypothetical protein
LIFPEEDRSFREECTAAQRTAETMRSKARYPRRGSAVNSKASPRTYMAREPEIAFPNLFRSQKATNPNLAFWLLNSEPDDVIKRVTAAAASGEDGGEKRRRACGESRPDVDGFFGS